MDVCRYRRGFGVRVHLLSQIALFAGLSEAEVQVLALRAVERRFAPDEILFWEGEPCDGVFLIIEGSVKIFRTSPGGREVMLAIETAPSSVAELPLFDGGPYPASVRAVEAVVSLFINKNDFQQVCRQYPDVALKVLAVVGRRLRHLVGLVEAMTFGSVTQRLARLLLENLQGNGSGDIRPSGDAPGACIPAGNCAGGRLAKHGALPRRRDDPSSGPRGANRESHGTGTGSGISRLKGQCPRKENLVLQIDVRMDLTLQLLEALKKRLVGLARMGRKFVIPGDPANLVQ